jgi:hypothetical protein
VHFGGLNDLVRIYLATRRDGVHFRLALIDDGFDTRRNEFFDPAYMQALFNHAYKLARAGYPWQTEPPGFSAMDVSTSDRPPPRAP